MIIVGSTHIEGTHDQVPEKGDVTADQVRREPHGSIVATAGHRAIAQSNNLEIFVGLRACDMQAPKESRLNFSLTYIQPFQFIMKR